MKILVVLPRFPYPLEKGDKLRAYHQIVELAKRHDIYLFCVSHKKVAPGDIDVLRPYCKEIRIVPVNRFVAAKNIVANWLASKSLQLGYWNTVATKCAYRKFSSHAATTPKSWTSRTHSPSTPSGAWSAQKVSGATSFTTSSKCCAPQNTTPSASSTTSPSSATSTAKPSRTRKTAR